MALNWQGPKGIDWCDCTWNPITGCLRDCWYCYVSRIPGYEKEPKLHEERLNDPRKLGDKKVRIFVGSTTDFYAKWILEEWRKKVFETINNCPNQIFQLLTKDPQFIDINYVFPKNVWVGTTVTKQDDVWRIDVLKKINARIKFISFEPLMDNINADLENIQWIIIGAMTGKDSRKYAPKKDWVEKLIRDAGKLNIPFLIKRNVKWPETIKEFPDD